MKEKFSSYLYVFKCSMLILSAIIGAGLASGQEVVVFFAQYGFVSLFFLVVLFALFFYGFCVFLDFGGKKYSVDFLKNDKFFKVFNMFSLFIFLVIGAAMVACLNDLLNEIAYEFSFPLWSLMVVFVSSILIFFGIKALLNISTYLVPLMIFGIVFICVKGSTISSVSPPTFSSDIPNLFILFSSAIGYGCCNLIVSSNLLFTVGKKLNKKQVRMVAFIVSLTLIIILAIIIVSILINDEMILFSNLPLVYLSFLIGKKTGLFFSIIIFISIITTLFTAQFSFHEILNFKKKCLSFLISIVSFFTLSLFGFSEIVKYLYPIIGGFGLVTIFYLKNLSFKPSFNHANNEIHSAR